MPQLRWFVGGSIAVLDWHCPGLVVGTGAEERADVCEVSIGRAGSHVVRTAEGETVVERTQLFCVNAGEVFRPVRRALGVDRRTRIVVGDEAMHELAGPRAPRFAARTAPLTARAALAHHELLRHVQAEHRDELAIHTLALELAGHACGAEPRPRPASSPAVAEAIRAVQEILTRRYAEPLTLTALADHVGLSPWHLSRSFRAQAGLGVHRYRTRLRLLAALDRIRDSRRPELARIAVEVGFSSHSHLGREFRAFFGTSPSRAAGPRRPGGDQSVTSTS
jgi:AraC family transcriptional regulator